MNISSAKQKGRRLCLAVKASILGVFATLKENDILVASSSVCGEDLILSPKAVELFPYSIECKNQEKLNIWKCLEQAEKYGSESRTPLLIFSRNRSKTYVTLELDRFLNITKNSNLNKITKVQL